MSEINHESVCYENSLHNLDLPKNDDALARMLEDVATDPAKVSAALIGNHLMSDIQEFATGKSLYPSFYDVDQDIAKEHLQQDAEKINALPLALRRVAMREVILESKMSKILPAVKFEEDSEGHLTKLEFAKQIKAAPDMIRHSLTIERQRP